MLLQVNVDGHNYSMRSGMPQGPLIPQTYRQLELSIQDILQELPSAATFLQHTRFEYSILRQAYGELTGEPIRGHYAICRHALEMLPTFDWETTAMGTRAIPTACLSVVEVRVVGSKSYVVDRMVGSM